MWSIKRKDILRDQEILDSKHTKSLMVLKVDEVDNEQVAQMNKEVADFGVVIAAKDKRKFLELNEKFEVLKFYDERRRKIYQLDNTFANMKKRFGKRRRGRQSIHLRITASLVPLPCFGPIVEISSTPQQPKFYTNDELNEEK